MFKKKTEIEYEGFYLELISKIVKENGKQIKMNTKSKFQINEVPPRIIFSIVLKELKKMCKDAKVDFYECLAFNQVVDVFKLVDTIKDVVETLKRKE